jgi:hypothetical protein
MELPNVKYRELDQSSVPQSRKDTLHGLIVQTLLGLDDKPYLVSSLDQFKRLFGGYNATVAPYFPQIKRALSRGVRLYIQRLMADNAAAATYVFASNNVTLTAKYKGTWANNSLGFTLQVAPTFKLTLTYLDDQTQNESFEAASFVDMVAAINANSSLISVTLGGGYTTPTAVAAITYLTTGSDGSFADTAAKDTKINALYAKFNDITEMDTISQLGTFTKAGANNTIAYADSRKDIMAVVEVDPALAPAAAATFMTNTETGIGSTRSSFVAVYYGSNLKAWSAEAQADTEGPVLLDVLSIWSNSDTFEGNRLKAPAGPKRGLIDGVKTFVHNLLSPARTVEASALVSAAANVVGSHSVYGPVVWGAKTLNRNNSALDNIHVRRMLLDLNKKLTPIYQKGLFETNEPSAWRSMYLSARPVLEELVKAKVIAPAYMYIGDQDASKVSDAIYNKLEDLANGIYKVKIVLIPYGYIEQIEFLVVVNSITGTITAA